ncbi:hypothetical protein B2J93_7248 [Marssonina coronariae]|uniref:RRM domain-containing protein n=1 Tax=Diplocarpon coronariae TaxID=2795749 RepID=A0A218Z6P8_9HELO|nr:hypothetical protein B2J93_7248 [Marssonina coronariae]
MASESPRGRARTRSPYSEISKDRGDFRSTSRPRRSITPRSVSRSPRRNGRYRTESRSVSRGRSPSPVRSTKVVIEKLTKNVNESHLREIFSTFGQIRDLDMPMNRSFNTNRGTAYILYTSESDAEAAIAHMHESQIDGAVINPQVSALLNKSDAAHHSRPTAGMRETQIRTDHDLPHGPDHLDDIEPAQDLSHRDLDHRLDEDEAAEVEEQEDEEKARDALEAEEREVEAIAATAVMTGGVEAGAVDEEDVVADIKLRSQTFHHDIDGQRDLVPTTTLQARIGAVSTSDESRTQSKSIEFLRLFIAQRPTSLSSKMAWLMQTEKLPENYQVDAGPSAARPKDLALPKSFAKSERSQRSNHSEDTCVDSEHDGPFADLPEPKKVDKLREQNRTKKESPSEGSQDTVRPVGSVKPSDTGPLGKPMKAEKSLEANDIEEECFDSDHGSFNTDPKNSKKDAKSGRKSRFAKPRHSETHASESPLASSNSLKVPVRPKKAEGSRQTSSTEAGCHDTEHTSISVTSYKPKKDPKTKKARSRKSGPSEEGRASTVSATPKILKDTKPKQAAKSRDTNDAGERCEDGDHDSIAVSPRDLISAHSKKAQNSQEAPDENGGAFSQECSHADHVPFSAPGHLNSSKKDKKEKRKKDKREKRAEKKKEKKARREAKEKEKTVKQLKKSDTLQDTKKGESHNEDRCSNGNHQLASTDLKHSKPKKSRKSAQEVIPFFISVLSDMSNLRAVKAKIRESRAARKAKKENDTKACNSVQEHELSDCEGVSNTDGARSRKASASHKPVAVESEISRTRIGSSVSRNLLGLGSSNETSPRTPAQAFPRGLQIMARNTDTLAGGFPFPMELSAFGFAKETWETFCSELTKSLADKKIAYAIENILDACAEYDVKLFRPNGFMMRLDMPGEEKYGLDLMDIYHAKQGDVHTDNLTATLHEKEHLGAIKHKHHSRERSGDVRHLESLRQKAFRSTRLILDPIVVLKDPELAARRGWDRWILACSEARRLAEETPPVKKDNKPWFGYFPVRMDRWPPSKHLYYERFRGSAHTVVNNKSSSAYIVPDHDSMDQRGAPGTSSILSCDEVEFVVLQPSAPESSSKQC